MSKHTKGNGTEDSSSIIVVTPDNIGKGIKWNASTETYEVNVGDGLEIDRTGKVVVKPVVVDPRSSNITDNGKVIGEKFSIDFGNGLIEVNGIIEFPLSTTPRGKGDNAFTHKVGKFDVGCSETAQPFVDAGTLYYKETHLKITAAELGMSKILSVNSIPMDLGGYRTEAVWLVNQELFSDSIYLGVHTLASLSQDSMKAMFQIKGVKA
nr:MAG TPA: hypothetical protein [Caudoviricetes sp.]